jgi:acyl carrier protein
MIRAVQEIQDWIVAHVSAATGAATKDIDVHQPFLRHGLDSVAVVALVADLERWLGYRFRENPLETHPTIAALAQYLAKQIARSDGTA